MVSRSHPDGRLKDGRPILQLFYMLGYSVLSFSLKDETIFLKTLVGGHAEAGVHVKVWAGDRVLMVWLCSFNTCWAEMPFHVPVSRDMSGGSY